MGLNQETNGDLLPAELFDNQFGKFKLPFTSSANEIVEDGRQITYQYSAYMISTTDPGAAGNIAKFMLSAAAAGYELWGNAPLPSTGALIHSASQVFVLKHSS